MTKVVKYLGLKQEDTPLTEEAAPAVYMKCTNYKPGQSQTWKKEKGIGTSTLVDASLMEEFSEPSADIFVSTENGLPEILKHVIGDPTSAQQAATSAYKHTYKSDDTLETFTIFCGSEDLTEEPYPGCVITSVELKSSPGEFLMATINWYGKKKGADNSINSPTYTTVKTLDHIDLKVEVDDTDISQYVGAVSVSFNPNFATGEFTAGSTEIQNVPKNQDREVAWSIEIPRYTNELRTHFNAGTEPKIEIIWTGANIEDTYYYKVYVHIPAAICDTYGHDVNERNPEPHTFSGFAIYDTSATSDVVVEITNTDTDI